MEMWMDMCVWVYVYVYIFVMWMYTHTQTPTHITGGYDSFGSCMHWGPYFALDYFEMTCQSYTLPKV